MASLHRAGLKERLETRTMHGGLYHNTFWVMQPSATPRSSFKQSLDTCCLLGGKAAAQSERSPNCDLPLLLEGANRGELRRQR